MKEFRKQVKEALKKACGKTGVLNTPPDPKFGDLASNIAFQFPKPAEKAKEIAGKIKPSGLIANRLLSFEPM